MKNSKTPLPANPVLGRWSAWEFIQTFWQKEALLIPAAMPAIHEVIEKVDLLAIACEPEAEARLIVADNKQNNWQCRQGPFKAKDFKSLPKKNWTLLVQAVDQWMPDVAELLKQFDFLPRWRLDDIMISYATQGGGVGPHFDHYDVFLIQASGTRRWQLGQRCADHTPLRGHPDMKLLKQFKPSSECDMKSGDMLYIPAGLAHWGTATSDDCITISIGFRAASQRELLQMAVNNIACQLTESERYHDTEAAMDSDPFCINDHAANHVQEFWKKINQEQVKQALARALGEYATEPRYPDHIDIEKKLTLKKLDSVLKKKSLVLKHNPASRFAYRPLSKQDAELYVDGETRNTSLKLAQAICHLKIIPSLLRKDADKLLLLDLINQGSLMFEL